MQKENEGFKGKVSAGFTLNSLWSFVKELERESLATVTSLSENTTFYSGLLSLEQNKYIKCIMKIGS